jgi:hypothetical protein
MQQRDARVRFKAILPIAAVILASVLMLISVEQRRLLHGYDAPPPTTAFALGFAFNGPAFMYTPYLDEFIPQVVQEALGYETVRLLLVALFWFLVGRTIDRRRQGRDLSLESPKSAMAIFSIGFALSCWFFFMAIEKLPSNLYYYTLAPYFPGELIISSSLSIWCAFLLVFFGGKTVRAIKNIRRA